MPARAHVKQKPCLSYRVMPARAHVQPPKKKTWAISGHHFRSSKKRRVVPARVRAKQKPRHGVSCPQALPKKNVGDQWAWHTYVQTLRVAAHIDMARLVCVGCK